MDRYVDASTCPSDADVVGLCGDKCERSGGTAADKRRMPSVAAQEYGGGAAAAP